MSAMADTSTDWQAEAVRLRREEKMETARIAEIVDRSPSRVRRVLAEANAARFTGDVGPEAPIPGQTTVDDFTGQRTEFGDDDPADASGAVRVAVERDPLEEFRAEAGDATGELQTRPGEETPDAGEVTAVSPPVRGTRQLALDFGENAAMVTSATIVLKSEKLASGHYGLGDVIHGEFTARVVTATGAEKFDKDLDDFAAKPTAYVALITEFEVNATGGD